MQKFVEKDSQFKTKGNLILEGGVRMPVAKLFIPTPGDRLFLT
jgi:hypothetical protein